ncbi:phage terminase large subunit [Lachnoclostridium sp. Marseille-P6806]|uniref:phage terminase large subunit n=1 Tax=Lachnoclostridium sp. Marseille-P6806 TaxID=2364793 RepID=UPI0010311CEE|nr:phage terminase large subunit [Lachnoclostridium sp. Marseille-P6806]
MITLTIGRPSEKQRIFLQDTHKHVGYGGARGGGKSWAIRTKAKLLGLKHPGVKMLIVRRTYPELQKNHIDQLKAELVPDVARYNGSEKRMTFKTGAIIDFMYCKNDDDLGRLQGAEYDVIFIDEATQLTEYQLKAIEACCRGVNDFPHRVYYTCNPGGQGHGYIKRIFIDRRFEDGEKPEDYSFTQALVQDNAALMEADPDYVRRLEALPPKLRKAWLDGMWDIFEGQFFEEFRDDPSHYLDREWTHVIEPFDIPPGWRIYRSYDFGYAKPFSCGWWAVDYDGRLYRILELYGCTGEPNVGVKWTAQEQFKRIHEIEAQHPYLKGKHILGVADPAIWNAESGESIADIAAKNHVFFEKGDNARITGWMQVHYRLQFDDQGIPMLYAFNTCKAFIRTMPLMMYDEHKVEDLDTDLEDHCPDEVRYMCMARPIKPTIVKERPIIGDDPLNQRIPKRKSIYISHG